MATRTDLSAHIPVNCGVQVARFAKQEWKSFHQRVMLAMVQSEARGNQVQQRREHGALSGH